MEESKIAKGFEYDNNQNVQTINQYILSTCEDLWYSYYLNLNEIFSDGNHELIPGASAWSQVFAANGGDSSASGSETEGATAQAGSSTSQIDESAAQSDAAASSGSDGDEDVSAG